MTWTPAQIAAAQRLLKRLTGLDDLAKAQYGAVHIRRGDRREYLRCTTVQDAVNLTAEAVQVARAAGVPAASMPWLLFVKGERDFADELRGNLTALGVASHVVLEREMAELRDLALVEGEQSDGGLVIDNYLLMRCIHWLVAHATVSIRSSLSNDWLWDHGEAPAVNVNGHFRKRVGSQNERWVYYLCRENENCADLINMNREC